MVLFKNLKKFKTFSYFIHFRYAFGVAGNTRDNTEVKFINYITEGKNKKINQYFRYFKRTVTQF